MYKIYVDIQVVTTDFMLQMHYDVITINYWVRCNILLYAKAITNNCRLSFECHKHVHSDRVYYALLKISVFLTFF